MRFILPFIIFIFNLSSIKPQTTSNFLIDKDTAEIIVTKDPNFHGSNVFRTIHEANHAISSLKIKSFFPKKNVIVWLDGDIYELDSTVYIDYNKDGKLGSVTFKPLNNEKVTITGGKKINPQIIKNLDKRIASKIIDKKAGKYIKVIDLKQAGITDYGEVHNNGFRRPYTNAPLELFINGQPYHLSRYPNTNNIKIQEKDILESGYVKEFDFDNFIIKHDHKRTSKWGLSNNILLAGNFRFAWATDQVRIKDISKDGVITFKDQHMYGITGEHEWNQYYFINILEEIDSPGEYYVDNTEGKLYFYPFENISSSDTIIVSILEDALITMKGCQNIHFDGIHFDAGRGIGIYMENTSNCTIENSTIKNMGVVAVSMGKGSVPGKLYIHPDQHKLYFPNEKLTERLGSLHELLYENPIFNREGGANNGIINCKIENIGKGGVSIGGGNRLTLQPGGNFVYNTEFTNCGRIDYSYKAPVNLDGVGNVISHCHFNQCPATAIYLHGNNHIIEYNFIDEACHFVDDQGAIYIGRDPSEYGNIIRYNYFRNIGAFGLVMAVYYDDGACGTELYGNIFYQAGSKTVMIGGGSGNKIKNNIFIDNPLAITIDDRLDNWARNNLAPGALFEIRMNMVNYSEPPYATSYPLLAHYFENKPNIPKHNNIENNVFLNIKTVFEGNESWGPFDKTKNLIIDYDPGFKNYKNQDFNLHENSIIFKKLPEFEKIPFSSIGLVK